jgi:hypothetical protein
MQLPAFVPRGGMRLDNLEGTPIASRLAGIGSQILIL